MKLKSAYNRVVSLQTLFWVALTTGSINAALAADGNSRVQLPGANDSFLQKIVNWMQSVLVLSVGQERFFLLSSADSPVSFSGGWRRNKVRL